MPYNEKLNGDDQVTMEERIAALLFDDERRRTEEWSQQAGRDILHMVLAEFRPDLIGEENDPVLPAMPTGDGQFHHLTLLVTLLTDHPLAPDTTLADIHHAMTEGDDVGEWCTIRHERVGPHRCAELCRAMDSEPEFMLGEYAWTYELEKGDEVWIDNGQPESTGSVIIETIVIKDDNFTIVTDEGETITGELSQLYDYDFLEERLEEQRRDEKHGLYPEHDDPAN